MKVLVLYQLHNKTDRNTVYEHLNSFRRYSNHLFHYVNVFESIPKSVFKFSYDIIIFHYTFLAGERFLEDESLWQRKIKGSNNLKGFKIAFPQDEYDFTVRLCHFIDYANIDKVYTCYTDDSDIDKAYRNNISRDVVFSHTLTGFLDKNTYNRIKHKIIPLNDRPIDIGYRARKLPAYFGHHGQLKYKLVNVFSKVLRDYDFVFDISSTNKNYVNENPDEVKLGSDWLEFLMSCKAFIGCEGGSSLLDFNGDIKKRVLEYERRYPNRPFESIRDSCFPDQDNNIKCYAISPRHFECAMTGTLQLLVEGEYNGVLIPNLHYIPIKRDFSNIHEVLSKLNNKKLVERIVKTAHDDICMSDKYTYESFVQDVLSSCTTDTFMKNLRIYFKIWGFLFELRNPYIRGLKTLEVFWSDNKYYLYRRFIQNHPKLRRVLRFFRSLLFLKFVNRGK